MEPITNENVPKPLPAHLQDYLIIFAGSAVLYLTCLVRTRSMEHTVSETKNLPYAMNTDKKLTDIRAIFFTARSHTFGRHKEQLHTG